jgi:hypothetical protein
MPLVSPETGLVSREWRGGREFERAANGHADIESSRLSPS